MRIHRQTALLVGALAFVVFVTIVMVGESAGRHHYPAAYVLIMAALVAVPGGLLAGWLHRRPLSVRSAAIVVLCGLVVAALVIVPSVLWSDAGVWSLAWTSAVAAVLGQLIGLSLTRIRR